MKQTDIDIVFNTRDRLDRMANRYSEESLERRCLLQAVAALEEIVENV